MGNSDDGTAIFIEISHLHLCILVNLKWGTRKLNKFPRSNNTNPLSDRLIRVSTVGNIVVWGWSYHPNQNLREATKAGVQIGSFALMLFLLVKNVIIISLSLFNEFMSTTDRKECI